MKKIVAEVKLLPDNSLYPRVFCVDEMGAEVYSVNQTLCDAIWELQGAPLKELSKLIEIACAGQYIPRNPELADFCINDKFIWIRPPMASLGEICISNENLPDYSIDEGVPQIFTLEQLNTVSKIVVEFSSALKNEGIEGFFGKKLEAQFPLSRSHES